jgi:hypothetical protein
VHLPYQETGWFAEIQNVLVAVALIGTTAFGTVIHKVVRLHATAVILVVIIIAEMDIAILMPARTGTTVQQTAAQVDILETIMEVI